MSTRYSIGAVAKITGLVPDTIRAWERRHRLVEPRRGPTGVRDYTEKDVVRLELARDATRAGHAIGTVATMSNADLRRLVRAPNASSQGALDESEARVVAVTLESIKQYDFTGATAALTAAAMLLPTSNFALQILAPLLREVGATWSEGRLDIAQEHAVSHIIRNLTGSLVLQHARGNATATPLIFATPPNEPHEFGIALGAMLAATNGYAPCVLGPNLPALELARAAKRLGAHAVVVGTLAAPRDAEVAAFLRILRGELSAKTRIWVGGAHAAALCSCAGTGGLTPIPTLELFADALRTKRAGTHGA